jgi:uncharacterized membrane protein
MTCRDSRLRNRNLAALLAMIAAFLGFVAAFIDIPTALATVMGVALFVAVGYVWSGVLTDKRIGGLERAAVAAGLAMIVPVLGGLVLYLADIPLNRRSWTGLLAAAAFTGSVALMVRRRAEETPDRPERTFLRTLSIRDCATWAVAILVAAGAMVVAVEGAARQNYGGFTQLWLSPDGSSHDVVGVTNWQGKTTAFRVVVRRSGQKDAVYNITLRQGQTWKLAFASIAKARVVADLYRLPVLSTPYRYVDTSGTAG